ncbi:hypothetical protein LYZ85_05680, partial [Xanthomonas hortorum pv. vitians]|nr:hypothetical protein [Xanthomonas hortorum pv. vitians]
EDLPASLLALAQALSVTERQLHGSLLNMGVVSLICGALFRGSLAGRVRGAPTAPESSLVALLKAMHTDHLDWSLSAHRRGTLRGMDAA